jgi:hypothetical protein
LNRPIALRSVSSGAGENLVFSAADFEDFLQTRPEMPPVMESELEAVVRHLAENRWPFRLQPHLAPVYGKGAGDDEAAMRRTDRIASLAK